MSVSRCQEEVNSREFLEWLAYQRIEPFGALQEDYRAGVLASLLYNPWRKEGAAGKGPQDFFPSLADEEPEEDEFWDTAEGQIVLAKAWVLSCGGTLDG